jgi:periplasmic copper chaperone A
MRRMFAAALVASMAPGLAAAHVTIDPPQAEAGAYVRIAFRVPHGCAGGAPTERLVVTLPEAVLQARPMPKPGWTLAITRAPLEVPLDNGHGGKLTERVAEIAWTGGPLEDSHYDEFVVQLRLSRELAPGQALPIPAVQHCPGGATAAWTEVPAPGRRTTEYRHPAPALRIVAPRTAAAGGN